MKKDSAELSSRFRATIRTLKVADQLGIYAVEVNALTESARNFYLKFGFSELLDDRRHLYLTVKVIRKLGLLTGEAPS